MPGESVGLVIVVRDRKAGLPLQAGIASAATSLIMEQQGLSGFGNDRTRVDRIGIVGTGFVADLYMRSLRTFPGIEVATAWDERPGRLAAFCEYWSIAPARSLQELLDGGGRTPSLVLNLTNPDRHFGVTQACLEAGANVYSEKPLAMTFDQALALHQLAQSRHRLLASAPCSVLGESAQTAWWALREGAIGQPRLVYAELDDDFITQAPYHRWKSESGAPWPAEDEFRVGCTLEHAGYYLTWLMAMFGPVAKVIAASAQLVPHASGEQNHVAPDFSAAVLVFQTGVVARLTCSIVAPHDHRLRVVGDRGVLEVSECWDNRAPVRVRRRHVVRRRLINSPWARRWKLRGRTHPHVTRRGAASMNFALGPMEALASLQEGRPCRLGADFALHLTEVTLAIQQAGLTTGPQSMRTTFPPMEPMPWAQPSTVGRP
jgi:predicted dehydrogenase